MKTIFKYWFIIGIIVTGFSGLLYVAVQQDLRHGADDPQIQMAEDAAGKLAAGRQFPEVVPTEQVDIAQSLAPYVIVFDATGNPIASSAQLNGQIPSIPSGIFDYVKQNGKDTFTWQPQSNVRSAVVVTQFQGSRSGFVLAGRSLREVERREDDIMHIVFLGWSALIFIPFAATAIIFRKASNVGKVTNK